MKSKSNLSEEVGGKFQELKNTEDRKYLLQVLRKVTSKGDKRVEKGEGDKAGK